MLGANLNCGIVQTRGDTRDKLNFRKGKGGRRQRKRATEYESVHQSMKGNGSSSVDDRNGCKIHLAKEI